MVQVCEYMFRPRGPFHEPLFDISRLSTLLYGMEFPRDFLDKCEWEYHWNFSSLFPALHDGSFYALGSYGQSRGQGDLRGFATFLCGTLADPNVASYRNELVEYFEKSLYRDGYKFVGNRLIETSIDTSTPAVLVALGKEPELREDLATELGENTVVGIVYFDLDHFKEVNDRLGHPAGNACLEKVVEVTSSALIRKGKLYRVGGDEFCAMLPNFGESEVMAVAERVRKEIDELEPFGGVVKVTASIGVAVSDAKQLTTPETLIHAADEAMYVAKFNGENRICLWPPSKEEAEQAARMRQKARRS